MVAANKMWTVMISRETRARARLVHGEPESRDQGLTQGHGPRPHAVDPVKQLEQDHNLFGSAVAPLRGARPPPSRAPVEWSMEVYRRELIEHVHEQDMR